MFNKKVSLNLKIGGGFLLILIFLVLVGIISFIGLRSLVKNNNVTVKSLEDSDFITKKLNDHLVWIKGIDDMFLHKKHFEGELDHTKCGFGKWYYSYMKSEEYKNLPFEVKSLLDDMEEPHKNLHNSAKEIIENYHYYDETLPKYLAEKEIDHLNWMNELINSCLNRTYFNAELDYTKCGFGQWYYSFIDSQSYSNLSESQKKIIRDIEDPHKNLHNSGKKILSYQKRGDYKTSMNIYLNETTVIVKELQDKFKNFKNGLDNYYNDNLKAKEVLSAKTIKYIDEIKILFSSYISYLNDQYTITSANSKRAEKLTLFLMLLLIIIAVVLGAFLAIVITRSITLPLTKISDKIKTSSSEIFNASSQLSSSSQQLSSSSTQLSSSSQAISDSSQEIANGASEQSASVEETISSVEELTSMVKQNFGNSKEAANLSSKASDLSEKGFKEMENMLSSMNEIKKSSDQIKNVIKVIDDIAFQTNILALNAAVEAARAGEAGMGFAVVADEVKNLANKSQEAAKETALMIETSIEKSQNGFQIASNLLELFKEILTGVKKANEVINEVGVASGEQEKGLDQVNKAVIQFDKVVQSNAATAEELASSSEELATSSEELVTTAESSSESADQLLDQVSILNNIIEQLVTLITGNKINITQSIEKKQKTVTKPKKIIKKEPTAKKTIVKTKKRKQKKQTTPIITKKEISPEQIIPFEEDKEFKELH